jgi:phospholipase C
MGVEDIKHVVILVQENRSFDEYFGTFPGATGFSDPSPLFGNPWPGSQLYPFRMSTFTATGEQGPGCNHDWTAMHAAYTNGAMNGWNNGNNSQAVLGYYTADDIPYHWALAQTFALCDHYFCSVLGGTSPNRLYLMSGAIRNIDPNTAGDPGAGPFPDNPGQEGAPDPLNASWESYADALTANNVSWTVYDETGTAPPWLKAPVSPSNGWGSLNILDQFANWPTYDGGSHIQTNYGQFEMDAQNGVLPTVSWLIPPFGVTEWEGNRPADGACYISQKLQALLNGPLWESTVFILTYDENDGHFDHVVPPVALANATAPEQPVDNEPIGAGFRVPAIIISPWTVGAGVQTDYFDHTSILQLLEQVTTAQGTPVVCENLPVGGYRRQTFGDLTNVFDFANPVGAAQVMSQLPSFDTVLQWMKNAEARFVEPGLSGLVPPNPQPGWPPPTQSCAVNFPAFSSAGVFLQFNRENSGAVPRMGPPGSATMENALIVTVYGFEPDEFIDLNAGVPPWMPQSALHVPQIPVAGGNVMCDTRVPTVTVLSGGGPGEFTFQCTQISANPNSPVAPNQSGVAVPFTFGISVTFNFPTATFGFRRGMVRTIGLGVSFTVDTTVTVIGEMKLDGGTLVEEPLGACARLAEQILQAELELAIAQREPQGPGSAERIKAMINALAALQQQYNQYCGSGGSGAPPVPGGPIRLGG